MSRYQILDAFSDVILVVDSDWRLHFGNTSACLLTELTPRRLSSGKPLAQFLEFASPIIDDGGLEAVLELAPNREVMFTLPTSGKVGWVQVAIQPVPEHMIDDPTAEGRRWIISMRDTTLERTLNDKYRGELDQKESVIRDLQDARKALEDYSLSLEKRVEARTVELSEANRLQKTILDSLSQGILVFDKNGICLPIFSKVCLKMLNGEPTGRSITDVLGFKDDSEIDGFTQWREAVFDQLLDFEDMVPLAPNRLKNEKGLDIHFDYYPMSGAQGELHGIVVVATDRTREMEAIQKAERERILVSKVTQVARNREAFRLFVAEARRLLGGLNEPASLDLEEIQRRLHTLKGGAASFSLMTIADGCHELENEVKALGSHRKGLDARLQEQSAFLLEQLRVAIGELAELLGPSVGETENQPIEIAIDQLKVWSTELLQTKDWLSVRTVGERLWQEATEKPVGPALLHHAGSLKALASTMGKRLESFDLVGGDTKMPLERYQGLLSSLVHAFRNCVYHGLETPDERVKSGKAEGGRVFAHFLKESTSKGLQLRIEIGDDGRGVDPERIRAKLNEKSLSELASGNDDEVIQTILRDDFSTASEVSLVAGRGVGLSAIASEVRDLQGSIRVKSTPGNGMTLSIEVPVDSDQQSLLIRKSA